MEKNLAKWISILIHPLIMPTLGIIILLNSGVYVSFIPWEIKKLIYLMVFLGTFLIPLCLIPFFLYQKIIGNIEMSERKERIIPLSITALFYFFTYFIFIKVQVYHLLQLFILGAAITILITLFITIKWKISAHLIGIGGVSGGILAIGLKYNIDIQSIFMTSILVAGLLGYSRLKLKAHTPAQIYAGYFTGLVIMLLIIFLGIN
ncbi:PAP2 family protein [Bacteroidota bacterium]